MRTSTLLLTLAATFSAAAEVNTLPKASGEQLPAEPRGLGKRIVLAEDDKPAFPEPPPGWDAPEWKQALYYFVQGLFN